MNPTLDRIDHAILAALQNDARLSNKQLATIAGLAPSSCLERVRRLERAGRLRGYHATVDPDAMGVGLRAVVLVQLRNHHREAMDDFRDTVIAMPTVRDVFQVAGQYDFVVHVVARDTAHLRDLVLDGISSHADVRHLETNLVFHHHHNPVLLNLGEAG